MYHYVCPHCGGRLDPGESCNCHDPDAMRPSRRHVSVTLKRFDRQWIIKASNLPFTFTAGTLHAALTTVRTLKQASG